MINADPHRSSDRSISLGVISARVILSPAGGPKGIKVSQLCHSREIKRISSFFWVPTAPVALFINSFFQFDILTVTSLYSPRSRYKLWLIYTPRTLYALHAYSCVPLYDQICHVRWTIDRDWVFRGRRRSCEPSWPCMLIRPHLITAHRGINYPARVHIRSNDRIK